VIDLKTEHDLAVGFATAYRLGSSTPDLESSILVKYPRTGVLISEDSIFFSKFRGTDGLIEKIRFLKKMNRGIPDVVNIIIDSRMTEKALEGIIPPVDAMLVFTFSKDGSVSSNRRYSMANGKFEWYEDWIQDDCVQGSPVEMIKSLWGPVPQEEG